MMEYEEEQRQKAEEASRREFELTERRRKVQAEERRKAAEELKEKEDSKGLVLSNVYFISSPQQKYIPHLATYRPPPAIAYLFRDIFMQTREEPTCRRENSCQNEMQNTLLFTTVDVCIVCIL